MGSPKAAKVLAFVIFALLLLGSARVKAQPSCPLVLDASPLLGPGAPSSSSWIGISVRLHNPGERPVDGSIELAGAPWPGEKPHHLSRAVFSVAARSSVSIEMFARSAGAGFPSLTLRVLDREATELCSTTLAEQRSGTPLLLDLTMPSRLAPVLRDRAIPLHPGPMMRGVVSGTLLAVTSPGANPATGDPRLPLRAAGYASARVVLLNSKQLARLRPEELDALGEWLIGGGSLAVVVSRPEDLRTPPLATLLGGPAKPKPAPEVLKLPTAFNVVPDPSSGAPPGGPFSVLRQRSAPSDAIADKLVGFAGHNLRDSPWGASASYGLGEVHLLAFDATREAVAADPWTQLKVVDLVRHAHERQNHIALPHAQLALDEDRVTQIRRLLDPNQGTRWTIGVSAILLLLYAALAGPVSFYRAARRGRPEKALFLLPIWAAAMLVVIVALGIASKGFEGRSRRLTLIEAAAGMSRGTATRFRGLYASSSGALTVWASDFDSVLEVVGEAENPVLVIDRVGARLEQVQAKPWETVLVREEGFMSLGGGVSVVRAQNGAVMIRNRSARDLLGAVVRVPGGDTYFFARIADGKQVAARSGKKIPFFPTTPATTRPTPATVSTALNADAFAKMADEHVEGLGRAWKAIEMLDASVDWWPEDVPVLIGQLEGGEGKRSDAGLEIDEQRVLLRVIGYGGVL